jgi:predicted ATPase
MRALGDRYPEVCERHFAVMRAAWSAHQGTEVALAGDSVLVAFADSTAAVQACAMAQQLLDQQRWPDGTILRVRMGIHAGLAFPRAGNYLALAVNQAARVMTAAHGGQVLVTADVAEQVAPTADVALLQVGRFRIRDFDDPVLLYQLSAPGLRSGFPAVRALPADGHNLVTPATALVGRDQELTRGRDLLRSGRLVTLTGPGGVGKSRLANEIGRMVAPDWPDGVWWVDLAPITDPALLGAAIAEATGTPTRGGDRLDELISNLSEKAAVILLDNCEHLRVGAADVVERFLSQCPACSVLGTSREPLRLARERVERVPPLATPPPGAVLPSAVLASPAVQLLVERAVAGGAPLTVGDHNARDLAEICRRLDGLPLALEFAAARLHTLQTAELLAGLNDRFRLLRSRAPNLTERQRTMEGALQWSERLLNSFEQICFRRLSIFRSSFSVAAAAVAAGDANLPPQEVPSVLWSLVDKSLVVADATKSETRYVLLESVREYAARRLWETTEVPTVASRLSGWFDRELGPAAHRQPGWTGTVGADIENLRGLVPTMAAVDAEQAQRICFTIGRYLDATESYQEGIAELQKYLDLLVDSTPTRVSLLACLGYLYLRGNQLTEAEQVLDEAETLQRQVGSAPDWDDVAVERARGDLAIRVGACREAATDAKRVLARPLSLRGRARMSNQLGIASSALGDLDTARSAFEQEVDAYRQLGDQVFEASAEGNLAEIALRREDYQAAAQHQRACCELALQLGMPVMVAFSLIVAARIGSAREKWSLAAELHAQADVILEQTRIALYESDRKASDEMREQVERNLGRDAYLAAQSTGRTMDLPTAVARANSLFAEVMSE